MDRERKPRFELIRGGNEPTGPVSRSFLVVGTALEPPARPQSAAQAPSRRIVSLGLEGLGLRDFQQILKVAGVRHIVDVRILAAFRGNGFRVHLVEQTFAELAIQYDRQPTLENPFTSAGLDAGASLKQYAHHLKGQWTVLQEIGRRAEQGPILLLGWSAEHKGSERELIVEEMARLGIPLTLLVARKLDNAIHLVPWPLNQAHIAPVPSNARRSRQRAGKASDAQALFPFASPLPVERQRK